MARRRVRLAVRKTVLRNEKGRPQEGVAVECPLCAHVATCYGTSAAACQRAVAELATSCPLQQADEHWYYLEEA